MSAPRSFHIPVNEQAEVAVLGACLADASCFWRASQIVRTEDFYPETHRHVFRAMGDLSRDNVAIDLVTVIGRLDALGLVESAGGNAYVASLANELPDPANVEYYARLVKDVAIKRAVLKMAMEVQGLAGSTSGTGAEALEHAQAAVLRIGESGVADAVKLDVLLKREGEALEREYEEKTPPFDLGISDLDRLLHGYHPGELTVIAADSGVGKTALALTLGAKAAASGRKVLVFSEEMTSRALVRRLLSTESRVHNYRLQSSRIGPGDFRDVVAAIDRMASYALWIYEGIGTTTPKIRAVSRALQMRHGLDLVVVDYLQIIGSGTKQENRTQEVTAVAREFKSIAKDLNVPLLTASQVTAEGDVRESRAIRHFADVLLRMTTQDNNDGDARTVTIEVVKQRNGPQGKGVEAKLIFLPPFVEYRDYRLLKPGEGTQ
jgi:replicative DNA helicase